jgi:Flp pilus assembly protein TadB
LYPVIAILCNGINLISILVISAALVLSMLQGWHKPYQEIEANNKSLEVIKTLFGAEEQKKAAELFRDNLNSELEKARENNQKKTYKKAILELQIEFLDRHLTTGELIDKISPINPYISLSYWMLFALTACSCISAAATVTISWNVIILAILLYIIMYICLILNRNRIWKKRRNIFRKIGFV